MDIFVFRYENILKLRLKEEDRCKNELAKRLQELQILKQELAHRILQLKKNQEEFQEILSRGCTVVQLREMQSEKKWIKEAILYDNRRIFQKEKEVMDARKLLGEASKRRKIMEKIKENEQERFLKHLEAQEELLTDQIVSFNDAVKRNT